MEQQQMEEEVQNPTADAPNYSQAADVVEVEEAVEGPTAKEELEEVGEEDVFTSEEVLSLSETLRSRRKSSLLTFAAITLPTLLVFGCLTFASIKAHQKKATWADLVKRHPPTLPAVPPIEPSWQAPPVHSAEERASPNVQVVRGVLWELVNQLEEEDPAVPSHRARSIMREVAKVVSSGQSTKLIGMTIELENVTEVGTGKPLQGPRPHLVTKFIGEGDYCILVSVQDVKTRQHSALRINVLPKDEHPSIFATGERTVSAQMVRTAQAILGVRGSTPLADVADEKGISAVSAIAKIRGMPDVLHAKDLSILSTVEVMNTIQVTLRDVIDALGLVPTGTRAYLASRVLKTVLHLQHAGWSSNQINSSSFAVQEDGSVLLFGFESSVPFNTVIPGDVGVSPVYTEPELLGNIVCTDDCEFQPIADAKSDLWSLGILLYEIMMDGELPFGLSGVPANEESVAYVLQLGTHASPESLTVDMEYRGIHGRWQSLIKRLLEPKRSKRISANEIVEEFPDLLGGLPELQVLEEDAFFNLFFRDNPNFYKQQAKVPIVRRAHVNDKRAGSSGESRARKDGIGALGAAAVEKKRKPSKTEAVVEETGGRGYFGQHVKEQSRAAKVADFQERPDPEKDNQRTRREQENEHAQAQRRKGEGGIGESPVTPHSSDLPTRRPSTFESTGGRAALYYSQFGKRPTNETGSSPAPNSAANAPETPSPLFSRFLSTEFSDGGKGETRSQGLRRPIDMASSSAGPSNAARPLELRFGQGRSVTSGLAEEEGGPYAQGLRRPVDVASSSAGPSSAGTPLEAQLAQSRSATAGFAEEGGPYSQGLRRPIDMASSSAGPSNAARPLELRLAQSRSAATGFAGEGGPYSQGLRRPFDVASSSTGPSSAGTPSETQFAQSRSAATGFAEGGEGPYTQGLRRPIDMASSNVAPGSEAPTGGERGHDLQRWGQAADAPGRSAAPGSSLTLVGSRFAPNSTLIPGSAQGGGEPASQGLWRPTDIASSSPTPSSAPTTPGIPRTIMSRSFSSGPPGGEHELRGQGVGLSTGIPSSSAVPSSAPSPSPSPPIPSLATGPAEEGDGEARPEGSRQPTDTGSSSATPGSPPTPPGSPPAIMSRSFSSGPPGGEHELRGQGVRLSTGILSSSAAPSSAPSPSPSPPIPSLATGPAEEGDGEARPEGSRQPTDTGSSSATPGSPPTPPGSPPAIMSRSFSSGPPGGEHELRGQGVRLSTGIPSSSAVPSSAPSPSPSPPIPPLATGPAEGGEEEARPEGSRQPTDTGSSSATPGSPPTPPGSPPAIMSRSFSSGPPGGEHELRGQGVRLSTGIPSSSAAPSSAPSPSPSPPIPSLATGPAEGGEEEARPEGSRQPTDTGSSSATPGSPPTPPGSPPAIMSRSFSSGPPGGEHELRGQGVRLSTGILSSSAAPSSAPGPSPSPPIPSLATGPAEEGDGEARSEGSREPTDTGSSSATPSSPAAAPETQLPVITGSSSTESAEGGKAGQYLTGSWQPTVMAESRGAPSSPEARSEAPLAVSRLALSTELKGSEKEEAPGDLRRSTDSQSSSTLPSTPASPQETPLPQKQAAPLSPYFARRSRLSPASSSSPAAASESSPSLTPQEPSGFGYISPIFLTQRRATSRFWNPEGAGTATTTTPPRH